MVAFFRWSRCAVLAAVLAAGPARGQWTAVSPGVDYREWTLSGPVRVFAVRMSRAAPDLVLDSTVAQNRAAGATEVISAQAARSDDSVTFWNGQWGWRRQVLAAVNGDFFDRTTGVAEHGMVSGGWLLKRFPDYEGRAGLVFGQDRAVNLASCVNHRAPEQRVVWSPTAEQRLDGLNVPRGGNQLILYTPRYQLDTGVSGSGVEVVIELDAPAGPASALHGIVGRVLEVRENQPPAVVEFDRVVLSATGAAAQTLRARAHPGAQVSIIQPITNRSSDCQQVAPDVWTGAYTAIGGNFRFLENGQSMPTADVGLINRAPRTALAYDGAYLFAVVVDGRSAASAGMSMSELAAFCRTELGASWGVNQDGGGSSTLVLRGAVKNVPSDGQERPVSNGLLLARLLPPSRSTRATAGQPITTLQASALRLGPGSDYPAVTSLGVGSSGVVKAHGLDGIAGTHQHWWRAAFAGREGWLDEAAFLPPELTPDAGDPGTAAPDAGLDDAGSPFPDAGALTTVDGGDENGPVVDAGPEVSGDGDQAVNGGCGCHAGAGPTLLALWWAVARVRVRASRTTRGRAFSRG